MPDEKKTFFPFSNFAFSTGFTGNKIHILKNFNITNYNLSYLWYLILHEKKTPCARRITIITNLLAKLHFLFFQDYKHLVAWQETWKTSLHANPQIFYNTFSQHYPIQDLYSNTAAILNDPQQVAHLKSTQPLHTHNQNRLVQGNPTHYFNNSGGTFNLNPVSQLGVSPVLSANLGSAIEAVNWCAHCSISFRLTSDLVQHMRNFHACGNSTANEKPNSSSMAGKISSDSVKTSAFKNVIKNFKCSSCGESFKERHHLTRHLSSHTTPISRLASNARYSLAASKNKLQVEQQETSDYKRAKITN